MRNALLLSPALAFLVAVVSSSVSCGGSSSETPWPVEPEASQFAPPSESATPAGITEDRADAGRRKRP